MIRISTAVKVARLGGGPSFADLMADAVIRVYSGALPTSANNAPGGTYLGYITRNGASPAAGHGLSFLMDGNGIVTRTPGEVWTLTGVATGTAGWARMAAVDDPPIFQPASARIDFEVNPDDGIGLLLASAALSAGMTRDVPYFTYLIPG